MSHIIFPPITKTADKALNIVYTLTVSVARTANTVVSQTSTTETFFNVHEHYDIEASDAGDCHMQISAWETNYAEKITEEVHVHVM